MLFNSYIFIFVFLPLTLGSYYGLHKLGKPVFAKITLILMSFWFYGYFNPNYLWIMCSSIIVNYLLSQLLQRKWEMSAAQIAVLKKSLLAIGLIFNLGLIFYFKYYDFFVDNLNKVFSTDFQLKNIVLPLGISFFTFQQVSYMVDSYRGETKEYNFADYALFVTFFPQLIAGPIVLHNEVLPHQPENVHPYNCTGSDRNPSRKHLLTDRTSRNYRDRKIRSAESARTLSSP